MPVYSDFRQGDMAAGGQGAPLVAFGDLHLFHEPGVTRAIHNLGGISNLTYLPENGDPHEVFAFDTGPANCLIDEAMERFYGLEYDPDGHHAASGRVNQEVLDALMAHPYLQRPPPKTTGREVFTLTEVKKEVSLKRLEPDDLIATLTAFTAASIVEAYERFVPHVDEIILSGGGALNRALVSMLRERLEATVHTSADLGWNAKDREALAFAVMGYFAWARAPEHLAKRDGRTPRRYRGKAQRGNAVTSCSLVVYHVLYIQQRNSVKDANPFSQSQDRTPSSHFVRRADVRPFSEARAVLTDAVAKGEIPCAVAVAGTPNHYDIVAAEGVRRYSDESGGEAVTLNTRFDLASLTKVVVTLPSILHLVDAGEVRLEHPVQPTFSATQAGRSRPHSAM